MGEEFEGRPAAEEAPLRCDFCGAETAQVRRVALDQGYDRLQTPHVVRYACERCSVEKERKRRGGGAPGPERSRA